MECFNCNRPATKKLSLDADFGFLNVCDSKICKERVELDLKRFQETQVNLKSGTEVTNDSNDKDLVSVIATLKSKLYQESIKSKHYTNAFNELNERLIELEKIVQPEKKTDFQKLQGWVHSKRHFH